MIYPIVVESIEAQNDIELPIVVKKLIDLSIVVEPVEAKNILICPLWWSPLRQIKSKLYLV